MSPAALPPIAVALALSLASAPVVAPLLAWWLSHAQRRTQCVALGMCAAWLVLVVLGAQVGLRLSGGAASLWVLLGAYWAYALLATSSFRLRPVWVGLLLGLPASLPLLAGVLAGTLGLLGLAFIVMEALPVRIQQLDDGRICHVYSYGNATTAEGGYVVTLREPLPWLPGVERKLSELRLPEPTPALDAACALASGRDARIGSAADEPAQQQGAGDPLSPPG